MGAHVLNFGWVKAEEAKAMIGDRVCLCGKVSSVELLLQGSIVEVTEACRSFIQTVALGEGLSLQQ